ncbi:6019_t:CDS:1, partial [Paraglomus occultum]
MIGKEGQTQKGKQKGSNVLPAFSDNTKAPKPNKVTPATTATTTPATQAKETAAIQAKETAAVLNYPRRLW